jgi:hypothetical protein
VIRRNRKLLLLHAAANALLMWLAYEWLGVDESTTGKLVLSAVDALAILTLVCWLYGTTMVWFSSEEPKLNASFRTALRHLAGLLGLAVAALVVYFLLARGAAEVPGAALKVASWLTWTIRRPVKPPLIAGILQTLLWLLRWVVLPVVLVPVAAAIAREGRIHWQRSRRHLLIPLLAVLGLWVPLMIVNWKPAASGFSMELASFSLRTAVAYALFVGSMLAMARVAGSQRQA